MHCSRCRGYMTLHHMFDYKGIAIWVTAYRCVICGNIEDEIILKNRMRSAAMIQNHKRRHKVIHNFRVV